MDQKVQGDQGFDEATRESMRRLGVAVSAGHLQADSREEFPREHWARVADSGLLGMHLPREYGGLQQSLVSTLHALEAFGQANRDGGLSFAVASHMVSVGVPLNRFGKPQQRARYLPAICAGESICAHAISEPHAGSDAFAMKTTARRRGSSYRLSGSKTFITNGPMADLFLVYAMTDAARGAIGGASALLVPRSTPGLTLGKPIAKLGMRTAPLCDVFFDDCEVPESQLLGEQGLGFPILDFVMKWEILFSFAIALGEMRRRLEVCVDYAKTRIQFGQTIGKFQSVANKLVDMRIGLDVSKSSLYRTAERVQRGENASMDVAITKLLVSEHNLASALHAVQIFGGHGYMSEVGLELDLRNAVGGTLYSGTSEVQRDRIAKLMGL